jgi:hypothetical protein
MDGFMPRMHPSARQKWCTRKAAFSAGQPVPRSVTHFGAMFMSDLPLSGIKILDLTRVLAGPLSAQMLADLGAEVIKIERPGGGDDARAFGPPYLVDPEGKQNNNNSFYLCANRGKKSVTVDIARPEGQEIIRALAKSADIMMENFRSAISSATSLTMNRSAPSIPVSSIVR